MFALPDKQVHVAQQTRQRSGGFCSSDEPHVVLRIATENQWDILVEVFLIRISTAATRRPMGYQRNSDRQRTEKCTLARLAACNYCSGGETRTK